MREPTPEEMAEQRLRDEEAARLAAEQQARLEAFRKAVEERDLAKVTVSEALEAANLAAAKAARTEAEADAAAQAAATASLRAAAAELGASRMLMVVKGFVRQMAVTGEVDGDEVVVSLIMSGEPPAEVLRVAESSQRSANSITDSLRELVSLTDLAQREQAAAAEARADADAAAAAATGAAKEAGELLRAARRKLQKSQKAVATALEVDPAQYATGAGDGTCAAPNAAAAFPNGMLPAEVLCPLVMAPGHSLRTDAAGGFDAMARAYLEQNGEPLCITDSYRPLSVQIALKKRKPYLAATPGTSNHGWGVAIDACGGIESFGTPAHNWMVANAALFGWVQPDWAQASGSKPEAWHWEFSSELAAQMAELFGAARSDGQPQKPRKQR